MLQIFWEGQRAVSLQSSRLKTAVDHTALTREAKREIFKILRTSTDSRCSIHCVIKSECTAEMFPDTQYLHNVPLTPMHLFFGNVLEGMYIWECTPCKGGNETRDSWSTGNKGLAAKIWRSRVMVRAKPKVGCISEWKRLWMDFSKKIKLRGQSCVRGPLGKRTCTAKETTTKGEQLLQKGNNYDY